MKEVRAQAEFETKRLSEIMRPIESKEELQAALPKIKKRFNRIADLAVIVRSLQDKQIEDPSEAGDQLFMELARLYEIPGCRELIESAQTEAIQKLTH